MPAKSDKQRRFMGMDLARLRGGEPTRTGMNEGQLRDFAGRKGRRGRSGKKRGYRTRS